MARLPVITKNVLFVPSKPFAIFCSARVGDALNGDNGAPDEACDKFIALFKPQSTFYILLRHEVQEIVDEEKVLLSCGS